jgi:hypothetical protein
MTTPSSSGERDSVASNQLVPLLNENDVARILAVSLGSLRRWRLLGQGPRFIKIGALVRYRPEDVQVFLDNRPTGGNSALTRTGRA